MLALLTQPKEIIAKEIFVKDVKDKTHKELICDIAQFPFRSQVLIECQAEVLVELNYEEKLNYVDSRTTVLENGYIYNDTIQFVETHMSRIKCPFHVKIIPFSYKYCFTARFLKDNKAVLEVPYIKGEPILRRLEIAQDKKMTWQQLYAALYKLADFDSSYPLEFDEMVNHVKIYGRIEL